MGAHASPAVRAKVLDEIVAAARRGHRCPSNLSLAYAAGVSSPASAASAVRALEQAGVIEVARGSVSRVVQIKQIGLRTAGRIPDPHWRVGDAFDTLRRPAPLPPEEFDPRLDHVDRDPCPRCGVRRDRGCSHSARPLSVASYV